jgi:hydroxypyruvate reductase
VAKPHILLIAPMMDFVMDALDDRYTVARLWELPDKETFLKTIGPQIRAVATNGVAGASRALMEALPALELIACNGVGVDAIDLEYAASRGTVVTTTPDVLTDDVADMAVALMLAVTRRIVFGDSLVRSGQWGKQAVPLTRRMSGKRAGIVGLGRIGKAVAHRLDAFDMKIAYTGRVPKDGIPYRFYPDLVELAQNSDFLVITASGGSSTRGIVNRQVLQALGPEGILVNVARGSLVDQAALIDALKKGEIAGAGLDVFEVEPLIASELFAMPQVVLQPHHASGTVESRRAMGELLLSNLASYFADKSVSTPFQNPYQNQGTSQ